MAKKASMKFDVDKERKVVEVRIEILSEDSMGCDATFVLRQRVRVKDSSPVHGSKTLYEHSFRTTDRVLTLTFPMSRFSGFSYAGSQIETGTLETLYQRLLTKGVTLTPLTTIKLIDGRTVVTENTISRAVLCLSERSAILSMTCSVLGSAPCKMAEL